MNKIKVIQIGVGHDHAGDTINSLKRQTDLFDLAGYVMLEGEEIMFEAYKSSYNGVEKLSLSDALSIHDLDAAVIETEDCNLTKYAYIMAERGLAIQMDKPGGQDEIEFDRLISYVKSNDLVFHMGYTAIILLSEKRSKW